MYILKVTIDGTQMKDKCYKKEKVALMAQEYLTKVFTQKKMNIVTNIIKEEQMHGEAPGSHYNERSMQSGHIH